MEYKPEVLGNKIKTRRKEKGLSQEVLGNQVGVSAKQISSYEHGYQLPPTNTLFNLCNALDCELGYLLGDPEYEAGTKFLTAMERATGLSQSSIDTMISFKDLMHGLYLPALNSLSANKHSLVPVLDALQELEDIYQRMRDHSANLKKKFGEGVLQKANEIIKSSSPENELEYSEEVEKAVLALNDLNDKEYELSELDIPAARYKVIRSFVELINTLYPSGEDYS